MKPVLILFLVILSLVFNACASKIETPDLNFFKASHPYISYTGRIDFYNSNAPRFWTPGVYIQIKFSGKNCKITLNDQLLYDKFHNYIAVQIDQQPVKRIKLTKKTNVLDFSDELSDGEHTIIISKNTESNIGYLEFIGISCDKLLSFENDKTRKIEFIGNSITCGTGSDVSTTPCGTGEWYDQHNAYMSYGPVTARLLNADWHLTAASGIGLMKSCCDMKVIMPDIIDKIDLANNAIKWDFNKYQPDVVTICLGQNDGVQDSIIFTQKYISLLKRLRTYYPNAEFVCLNSPMGNEYLTKVLKNYITGIVEAINANGDTKISSFFYSKSYTSGCDTHPSLSEHQEIAKELSVYLKSRMNW